MSETAAPRNDLYEADSYDWTQEQAWLLRARRWDDLDLQNLIDEVESVGRIDKHQIQKRLKVILAHLLKWKYQPGARSSAWRGTLREQLARLAQSPDRNSPPARSAGHWPLLPWAFVERLKPQNGPRSYSGCRLKRPQSYFGPDSQIIEDSPSLRSHPASVFDLAYLSARLLASKETGIDLTLFPEKPPFTLEQALDDEFLPKEPDLYDQS